MPRFFRVTSFAVIASLLGTSYYYYAVQRSLYKEAEWYKITSRTQDLIDRKADIPVRPVSINSQEYVVRTSQETIKDIWNEQIRNIVQWIYSWSH
ncbi:HBR407Cp [Eremothecium sinecaudum]|uniref:MICOS complex subunit MIC12 n=1 Tax=Eremothecium sinecaudum TaxID=45286 RepID=A0A109UXF1_9SACH|nr:HBR407Cp [Eremothecium sinecaudum]AMD19308.1 HBR407Cp [Eremothecium sinecaudum]